MPNNENDKDNLEWEESTAHRDKLKNKKHGWTEGKFRTAINGINVAIRAYNATIGKAASILSGKNINIELKELNPDKTLEEIQETGGNSFGLGIVDDLIKGVRRMGIPALQAMNFMGLGGPQIAAFIGVPLAAVEIAIDHIKDLMLSGALSGLAAEVGDIKDGQAKLNSKINDQGKAQTEALNKLSGKLQGVKSDLEGQIQAQGDELRGEISCLKSTTNRLDSAINNLSNAHSEFKTEVQNQFSEVNERIDNTDIKVTKNARDILEERLEREAIDNELRDKIKANKIQLN